MKTTTMLIQWNKLLPDLICSVVTTQLYLMVESAPIEYTKHHDYTDSLISATEVQSVDEPLEDSATLPLLSPRPYHESPEDSLYSPFLLYTGWTSTQRLLMFTIVFIEGFITNIFFMTSFSVHDVLQRTGNLYLACTGLADLCVTCVIAPTAAVVLLSAASNYNPVPNAELNLCHFTHFLGALTTYIYSFFHALAALEQYTRVCWCPRAYARCLQLLRPRLISAIVLLLAGTLAYAGVFWELDVDYCERKHHGNYIFRTATTISCYLLPFCIAVLAYTRSLFEIIKNARIQVRYKRSDRYCQDLSMVSASLVAYLVFVLFWFPHFVVNYYYPNVNNRVFYLTAWLGIFRSVFAFMVYVIAVKSFQESYSDFFRAIFLKSDVQADTTPSENEEMTAAPAASNEMHSGLKRTTQVDDTDITQGNTTFQTNNITPDNIREVVSTNTRGFASTSTLNVALTSPLGVTPTEVLEEISVSLLETASLAPKGSAQDLNRTTGTASISTQTNGIALPQRVASSSRLDQSL